MKENSFPILQGDFFATFDHMELTRFSIDCGNYLISVFSALCVFLKHSFGQTVPLAFIADIGLRKVVLRAETLLPSSNFTEKKLKIVFFVIPFEGKVVS